jgi:hypothetical protein
MPITLREALVPSIHDGGEHLCGITLIRDFYVNDNTCISKFDENLAFKITIWYVVYSHKLLIYDLSDGYSES